MEISLLDVGKPVTYYDFMYRRKIDIKGAIISVQEEEKHQF